MTFNVVDIFGYDRYLATVNFNKHVVLRFGATRRPLEMEHGPDSVHVFFPFDGVVMMEENKVLEPFFTIDFFTTNPGRAVTTFGVTD